MTGLLDHIVVFVVATCLAIPVVAAALIGWWSFVDARARRRTIPRTSTTSASNVTLVPRGGRPFDWLTEEVDA